MFYEITLLPNFQMVCDSWSNWNLETLIFVEGGKLEHPEKYPQSKGEKQQTTQLTYAGESENVISLLPKSF
jgi:hypothetical protein